MVAIMIITIGTLIHRATTYYKHEPWEEYLTLIGNIEVNSHRLVELSLTNYTQPLFETTEAQNSTENFVDNISDVDSSADKGTHSNFTTQQSADSFFDTLTEENTGGSGGSGASEWLDCDGYDATYTEWTTIGPPPYLNAQDQPINYVYEKDNNDQIGWFSFPNTNLTGVLNINITICFQIQS